MTGRILRLPEVLSRTGLGRSSVYEYERLGKFPKRVRLGARAIGWHQSDIEAWMAARPLIAS